MTSAWNSRIQGVALNENLAAADSIAAQLPNANHSQLFSTGIRLRDVSGTDCVARFVDIAARAPAAQAAAGMLSQGIPPSLVSVRIIDRSQEDTTVAWLLSLGYVIIPGLGH